MEDEFAVILTKNPHPGFYFYHNLYAQNFCNTKVLTVMLFCMLMMWDKTGPHGPSSESQKYWRLPLIESLLLNYPVKHLHT